MSASTGAGLAAGFNIASAFGRIACGLLSDVVGPLNTLFISFMLTALSMRAIWPESTALAPLAVFVVINGQQTAVFFFDDADSCGQRIWIGPRRGRNGHDCHWLERRIAAGMCSR